MKINLNYESELIYPSIKDLDDAGNFTQEKNIKIDNDVYQIYVSYWYFEKSNKAKFESIYVYIKAEVLTAKLAMLEEDIEREIKKNLKLTL